MRWEEYASGSRIDHFAWWCETYLVQSIDQFAGEPLVLEPWQVEFMGEALATSDPTGATPSWGSVALVVSRKNGKTSMLAAYALYRLLMDETQPEILLAAASDKQAGRLFDAIVSYIRRNPELASMVVLREYIGEIARADGGGKIMRMASDPNTLHGFSPSLVIADELAFWTKPTQRKAWAALTTGGGARKNTQTFTITTAGDSNERETGILGRMIDRNEAIGEVEKQPGLTISRNTNARTLVYNYSAPTKDATDSAALLLANPASWITEEYLERQAANPEISAEEVLQLHGCVWVAGANAWISADWWNNAIERDAIIEPGSRVSIGIDVGIVHDATACVMAWQRPDDQRIVLEAKIWTPTPGRNVDLAEVEDHIRMIGSEYELAGCFYDPRFFERSAQTLDAEGLIMVTMPQNSATMADAYQTFYAMLGEGNLRHSGTDGEFAQHCLQTVGQMTDRGWKISKMRQRQRIDALVAGVMATYGAVIQSEGAIMPGFFSV
jgi:phage terminase large subunit-like protein